MKQVIQVVHLLILNAVYFLSEPDILSTKTGRRKRGPRPQVKYTGM